MSEKQKESRRVASHGQCNCSGRCKDCRCENAAQDTTNAQLTQVPVLTGMVWLPSLGALVQ